MVQQNRVEISAFENATHGPLLACEVHAVNNVVQLKRPRPPRAVAWPNTAIVGWMRDCLIAAGADPNLISDNEPPRLLRLKEVEQRCGIRRSSIYRKIEEGSFPKPILISGRQPTTPKAA